MKPFLPFFDFLPSKCNTKHTRNFVTVNKAPSRSHKRVCVGKMSKLPPLVPHFTPEGSPLNKTYEQLLREAHRKDALDERKQQRLQSPTTPSTPTEAGHNTSPASQSSPYPATTSSPSPNSRKKRRETPEFDGSHVQSQAFATDLLARVGINDEPEERDFLSTAETSIDSTFSPERHSLPGSSIGGHHSSRGGTGGERGDGEGGGGGEVFASPTMLRRNVSMVQVLNDVQQVTLCFQEIIKHISFHRVNTGRVLWKLQATYVQLFERLIKVFSQRAKKKAEAIKESGGQKNEELDMLRLQVMDKQAKLDAAEKTKHSYKDTIKEQHASIGVLETEIDTLRAAIVEEAFQAEEQVKRRNEEEQEIRHKVQLDLRERQDARKALFGKCVCGVKVVVGVCVACHCSNDGVVFLVSCFSFGRWA